MLDHAIAVCLPLEELQDCFPNYGISYSNPILLFQSNLANSFQFYNHFDYNQPTGSEVIFHCTFFSTFGLDSFLLTFQIAA